MTPKVPHPVEEMQGRVHCYMCTHNVSAKVVKQGAVRKTKPGQLCPRCNASLDSGFVLEVMPLQMAA